MLKQSGNTVDKGVFFCCFFVWLKYKQEDGHKRLVLKPQIQGMAREFKHCETICCDSSRGGVPSVHTSSSESFTPVIYHYINTRWGSATATPPMLGPMMKVCLFSPSHQTTTSPCITVPNIQMLQYLSKLYKTYKL